jgi:hypothetical protein
VGQRGPIGKDPEARAGHRSKAEKEAHENVAASSGVRIPRANGRWSPSAKAWWQSLRESPLVDRYELTDWALARRTCELMTKADRPGEPINASVERVIQQNMSLLLTSIGDRRRQQLEVRRTGGTAKASGNVTPIETAPGYSSADLFG